MNKSKIQLSAEEMELVTNSDWILTKQRIIEKVYELFGNLSAEMQAYFENKHALPAEILSIPPKISKGEQYQMLPYVVLDYPRYFSKTDVFAVRTFFWWGNFFSISLQLKGKFKDAFEQKLTAAISHNQFGDFFLSASGDEFSFNLRETNHLFISREKSFAIGKLHQNTFIKITHKIPLEQWNTVPEEIMNKFLQMMNAMVG